MRRRNGPREEAARQWMKAKRLERGWSLAEIGSRIGYSPKYLIEIENGTIGVSPKVFAGYERELGAMPEREAMDESETETKRKWMRAARRARKITITEMAKRIGYARTYLSTVESGSSLFSERMYQAYRRELGAVVVKMEEAETLTEVQEQVERLEQEQRYLQGRLRSKEIKEEMQELIIKNLEGEIAALWEIINGRDA